MLAREFNFMSHGWDLKIAFIHSYLFKIILNLSLLINIRVISKLYLMSVSWLREKEDSDHYFWLEEGTYLIIPSLTQFQPTYSYNSFYYSSSSPKSNQIYIYMHHC
ncbi:hypothetical protein AAHE18_09G081100 [Arachis hypogaea]